MRLPFIFLFSLVITNLVAQDNYHSTLAQQLSTNYNLQNGTWIYTNTEVGNQNLHSFYGDASMTTASVNNQDFSRTARLQSFSDGDYFYSAGYQAPNQQSIRQGDNCLMVINLRRISNRAKVNLFVNAVDNTAFELGITLPLHSEWTQYLVPFQASRNYNADELTAGVLFGWETQEFEVGGMNILNFGNRYSLDQLPQVIHNDRYEGYEPNAPWRAQAAQRIEQNRKANLTVEVVDANGTAVDNATVSVNMLDHAFDWGVEIALDRIAGNIRQNNQYQTRLLDMDGNGNRFNWVVPGNSFKWLGWEQNWMTNPTEKVNAVRWLKDNDFLIRQHTMVWPGWIPSPVDIAANPNPNYIRNRTWEWIEELTSYPGLEGMFEEYDILNEIVVERDYERTFANTPSYQTGREFYPEVMAKFAQEVPNAPQVINDYVTISRHQNRGAEYDFLKNALQEVVDSGAPLSAIGFQAHITTFPTSIYEVEEILNDFGQTFNLPLKITEYDTNPEMSDAVAGQYMEDFLTMIFSLEQVEMLMFWGFWDGYHWFDNGNFYDLDWNLKPAGRVAFDKIFNEWWTNESNQTAANGNTTFRPFKGQYEIIIDYQGETIRDTITLEENQSLVYNLRTTTTCPPQGTACNDDNPNTEIDVADGNCGCAGTMINSDCNQLVNGNFDVDIASWNAYGCTPIFNAGTMEINGIVAGQNPWDAAAFQSDQTITQGQTYTIIFDARAAANRSIAVKSGLGIEPFTEYFYETVDLTTQMGSFSFSFTMNSPTTNIGTLEFFVGTNSANVFLDNVSLQLSDCEENMVVDNDNDGFDVDNDCDDNNAAINPNATEIANNNIDEDCDGTALIIDNDNDGFNSSVDCNDNNAAINPNSTEVANNNIDEDCDGTALMIDNDNDGFNSSVDCDDNNAAINPNATEIVNNNIDEDCDGMDLIETTNPNCNLITNSEFATDIDGWNSYGCTPTFNAGMIAVGAIVVGANPWDAAVGQFNLPLIEGRNYTITFDARASAARSIAIKAGLSIEPFTDYLFEEVNLSTQMETYTFSFVMAEPTTTIASLDFFVGTNSATVFLDNVSLQLTDCNDNTVVDNDNDGFNSNVDCDDNNATINPNAMEIANNNIDEDCNGSDLVTNSPVHPVTGIALNNNACITTIQENAPVCIDEWGMECQYLYDDCTGESVISPFIHVDQFGYRPADAKWAVLSDPVEGYNSFLNYTPSTNLQIRNAQNNAVIYTARPVAWNNGATHEQSGDRGWWFDFSSIAEPGSYYVFDAANNQRSATFDINENVYQEVLKHAGRMFYYNRSGIAKATPFAEPAWTDGIDFNSPGQYTSVRSFFDQDNPATARDLSGGWWDAGDYNKYVTFTNSTLHNMMWAYIENPDAFTDAWNIPESGNGVPDILDEIKWELDWLFKMNNRDGSTILKVGSLTFDVNESAPPSSNITEPLFYISECSSAAIAVVSTFAQAAKIFSSYPSMAGFVQELEQRAITTWNFVLPTLTANQLDENCDNMEVVAGDADWTASLQRGVAVAGAIHLYDLTGDQRYQDYIIANIADTENIANEPVWSPYTPHIGEARLLYTTLDDTDAATRDFIVNSFRQTVTQDFGNIYGFQDLDLYRADMPDWGYHTGSSLTKAGFGILNILAEKSNIAPNSNADFRLGAKEKLHYFHGVNPQGITYLTNMYDYGGDRCVDELFHSWFQDDSVWDNVYTSQFGPASGYLAGGPNQYYEDYQGGQTPTPPGNQPIQKSYWSFNDYDYPSFAVTEPAIYYQAAYIRLLAEFTTVDNENNTTSILDVTTKPSFKIYPNPTIGSLTIAHQIIKFAEPLPLEVIDVWGRVVVARQLLTDGSTVLDVAMLSDGIYFLKVGEEVHRFILSKN